MKKAVIFITAFILSFLIAGLNTIKAQKNIIQGTWSTQANQYGSNTGQRYTFYFPPGGIASGQVWGTNIYTTDCSVASAAVHAGLITTQNGGTVTIEILPGQTSYKGSVHNGVSSSDWGYWSSSFTFVNDYGHQNQNQSAETVANANWLTNAMVYNGNIGQQYTYYFPPNGITSSRVWGTDIYTLDCSIACAAVHAGLITAQHGGKVTIEILPGQDSYNGSVRNGITSSNWGSFIGSFRFVRKHKNFR